MNRYWRGGTGTWDASNTANWSATSGGAGGASAPTLNDDVFFDANSDAGGIFTVTIGTGAVCRDITIAGLDQVMTLAGSAAWSIYGSLAFPATNLTRTYTGLITFAATTTGKTITTNGLALTTGGTTFNGVGGEWTLGGAFVTGGTLALSNGVLDVSVSNYSVTCGAFSSASNKFTPRLGTLNVTNNSVNFLGGTNTYYDVVFINATAGGGAVITGSNAFNNLIFTSPSATGLRNISIGANQTVNGTLTLGTANTAIRRMFMFSDVVGTPRTITAANVATLADVDFRDIVAAGASGTWSGTRLGNCLGNSNITFDASKSVYRVGTGNWSATQWALSSGGAVNVNNFPLAQDDAVFDTNTTTGTHTLDASWNIGGINFSALTVAVTFATGTTTPSIYRDFVLDADVTITGTGLTTFAAQGTTQVITSAGKTLDRPLTKNGSGTLQLTDNLTQGVTRTFTHTAGTIDLNDNDLNAGLWSSTGAVARHLDTGATGELHIAGATFTASGSNLTTEGTGSISMDSASSKTFAGGGFSWPTLNQGGAGELIITGANRFKDMTNTVQPCTITFPANVTTQVEGFSLNGTPGNLVSIRSSVAGQRFNLVKVV